MKTIRAVYEHGVFRPLGNVELPERCTVEFEPRPIDRAEPDPPDDPELRAASLKAIYEVLSRRYSSGETDVAARHNEHQP
jgi:predicted DNA-binding antitoxin AbrB/MazE fold protein